MGTAAAAGAAKRALTVAVVMVALVTAVGLVVLWPRGDTDDLAATNADLAYVDATVVAVDVVPCTDPAEGLPTECQSVAVDVTSGPLDGEGATFLSSLVDLRTPRFAAGDELVLTYNPLAPPEFQHTFVEFQREVPLLLLAALFVAAVVLFGRWKGLRALAGLVVSVLVVLGFSLPSLLRGNDAVAVALVTTSAVAFAALYLAHGVNGPTTVAVLGTLASVVAITALAAVVTAAADLSGIAEESFQVLRVTAEGVDLRGILVAGIVIGALGVLDDVTVTQVSAVGELRRAAPDMPRRDLYRSAVRIGRDHVASTVNTLVLAYVGASLALLLFFLQEGRSVQQVLTREVVAVEIVRALVGSIGLILSVPITTGLAVLVSVDGGDAGHAHASAQPQ